MEYVLRNLMEEIVISKLDELIKSLNVCCCDQCRLDIASYALNRLPAKYTATKQGELISKLSSLDNQFKTSVVAAIVSGAEIVKSHPRHEL